MRYKLSEATAAKTKNWLVNGNPNQVIQSTSMVNRIADILLGLSKGKNSVTEIAEDSRLSISTTHRILNILAEPGFTIYDPTSHQYYMGPLINQLAENHSIMHQFLLKAAKDEMLRMSNITQETLLFTVLKGIQQMTLAVIQSQHSLRVHEDEKNENVRQSLVPMAAGQKVLLAQLDENRLTLILKSVKILDDPVLDSEQVGKELKQTKDQGYAITREVRIPDVMSISVPVRNYMWPLALTVIGPITRLDKKVSAFTTELLASSDRLSNNIQKFYQQETRV
jgi:DNA-binding IclR family transcriptional regulator